VCDGSCSLVHLMCVWVVLLLNALVASGQVLPTTCGACIASAGLAWCWPDSTCYVEPLAAAQCHNRHCVDPKKKSDCKCTTCGDPNCGGSPVTPTPAPPGPTPAPPAPTPPNPFRNQQWLGPSVQTQNTILFKGMHHILTHLR
jgi:hypothetical protein